MLILFELIPLALAVVAIVMIFSPWDLD